MWSAASFLSQPDPLTDPACPHHPGSRLSFEAFCWSRFPRGIAMINLDIAVVRVLTAESLDLSLLRC